MKTERAVTQNELGSRKKMMGNRFQEVVGDAEKEAWKIEVNESEGRKVCLKYHLISFHESFRIFFCQRRLLFSFVRFPTHQPDVVAERERRRERIPFSLHE